MKKYVSFSDEDADELEKLTPLSAEQARRLRDLNPSVSPWSVVALQAFVGSMVALAAWRVTGEANIGWSAGYGAVAVVIPAAIFARGLTSGNASGNPGASLVRFLMWEMVKLATTTVFLIAAPVMVAALSWPSLLVGMVLVMKVYWIALAYVPRKRNLGIG